MKHYLAFIFTIALTFSFAQTPNNTSLSDKIYGLSKFWSEVNNNFVYVYKLDKEKWEFAYKKAISNIQKTKNDYEYYRELQKLCAVLNDGHTQVFMPEELEGNLMNSTFGDYYFSFSNISGKTIVTSVSAKHKKEIPIGSMVISVNNIPIEEYQDRFVIPYISTSSEHTRKNTASRNLLLGNAGEKFEVEFLTPNKELKKLHITLAKYTGGVIFPIPEPKLKPFYYKLLDQEIGLIQLNSFENVSVLDDFKKTLPEIRNAKSIIIDIRNNQGGSSKIAKNIAKYFIQGDSILGAKNSTREIIPVERALGSFLNAQDTLKGKKEWGLNKEETIKYYQAAQGARFYTYENNAEYFDKVEKINVPVVILTDNNTASAAEDFLIYLYNQENITRIGDYTYGSTGQPLQIELPNGGSAWICTKKVTLPSGEEFVGTGIKPQILVKKTIDDYIIPDSDSQLEKAIRHICKKSI